MSKCEYCDIIEREDSILFQNEMLVVAVRDHVVTPGQITVFPREHFTILEQVPKDVLAACTLMAKKVSIAVFDGLGSQGTNVIIRNGLGANQSVPHFGIDIVPRQENDGLNFQWKPKSMEEYEIESVMASVSEEIKNVTTREKKQAKKQEPKTAKDVEVVEEKKETKKKAKNYLLKSVKRMP